MPAAEHIILALAAIAIGAACGQEPSPPFYPDKQDLLHYLDARGERHAITTPAEWQQRRAHILANMQLVMGEMPDDSRRVALDMRVLEETQTDKYLQRTITFAAEEGDRVPAYLLIPNGLEGKAPGMLCLHPTTPIGKRIVVGMGGKPNRAYAQELAERGYVTLAPDYPGYGDYEIDVYARGYVSATMKGIWNHRRAVDLLQSLPEVDGERIGCIGHSLGGHNSLFVAVFDDRLKAVVTSCGFNSFPKYYGGDLTGWSHSGYMPRIATVYGKDPQRMPFDFPGLLAAIAPRAVFVNAPLGDANFEVSGVHDCLAAAKPVYALLGAEQNLVAVHPDCEHDFPAETREAAYSFLERALASRREPQ